MRKACGPAVIAELDTLRSGLGKVTDEGLRETLGRYKAMA